MYYEVDNLRSCIRSSKEERELYTYLNEHGKLWMIILKYYQTVYKS